MCLENGFSHSIPSMCHVSRSRDIKTNSFWSFEYLNFEKTSEIPQFWNFFDISNEIFFLIPKVQGIILADPGTLSDFTKKKNQKFQITTKIHW